MQKQQAKMNSSQQDDQDRGPTPNVLNQQPEQNQQPPQKCPRCDSLNTKFCYYNNYSLSQPRHFCKACRRYWTQGGTLRNVPVGGGCRKKRTRTSSAVQPKPVAQIPMQQGHEQQKNLAISTAVMSAASPVDHSSGGLASYGYNLSSFAAINHHHQSLNSNNNPAYAFSDLGGVPSNSCQLQGFNNQALYQQSVYLSQQSNRAVAGGDHHGWPHQSFMPNRSSYVNDSSAAAPDSVLWANPATATSCNIGTTTTTAAAAAAVATTSAGLALNPIQWPDLSGSFDPAA